MRISLRKNLGNILIISSVVLFIYIYLPIISLYLLTQKPQTLSDKSFFINIPKIDAYSPILENIDPWDKKIYKEALKKGVAHAKGSSLPGDGKLIFLFAHSSDNPLFITRYNTVFFRLGELETDDLINITKDGKEYKYLVYDKREVWPNEVEYLKNVDENILIVQTCTPIGTDLKRLLIFARPI